MSFEAKKTGFGQAQDGWSLTLRIQDIDLPPQVRDARKGTRYMVALVELSDDETPVMPAPAVVETPQAVERREWKKLPYPQRAAMRCQDKDFQQYLAEEFPVAWGAEGIEAPARRADGIIKRRCGVTSKRDISAGTEAAATFDRIDADFLRWKNRVPLSAYENGR